LRAYSPWLNGLLDSVNIYIYIYIYSPHSTIHSRQHLYLFLYKDAEDPTSSELSPSTATLDLANPCQVFLCSSRGERFRKCWLLALNSGPFAVRSRSTLTHVTEFSYHATFFCANFLLLHAHQFLCMWGLLINISRGSSLLNETPLKFLICAYNL
jgi:hypothetical protein